MKFNEFTLSEELLKGIAEMGFEEASPIQKMSMLPLLEGRDVIGQAQTGTGKTAAFGIPMLEMVTEEKKIQGLVLCPTRELCMQVSQELSNLGKYKSIKVLSVYGGTGIERQIRDIKRGIQIIVGTPGRVMDHMRRKTIRLNDLKIAVLDEADEMFDMGFRDDMKTILNQTNEDRQTCFFSATMGAEIQAFSKLYQKDPQVIRVEHKELTVGNIRQYYIEMNESMKVEITSRLVDIYEPKLAIVFCNTKRKVDTLVEQLTARGYSVDGLHGDLKQNQRDNVMRRFRQSSIDILVATDVAARGIDVDDIDVVINYDLPQDEEYYVHRIGRTARAGRKGRAFSFVVGVDRYKLQDIVKYTKAEMQRMEIPTIADMDSKSSDQLYVQIAQAVLENQTTAESRHILDRLLRKDFDSMQIAEVLIALYAQARTSKTHEKLAQVDYGEKFVWSASRGGKKKGAHGKTPWKSRERNRSGERGRSGERNRSGERSRSGEKSQAGDEGKRGEKKSYWQNKKKGYAKKSK